MSRTPIQWTDHSINPIRARDLESGRVGHHCVKVSPGCKNCYSSRLQPRFGLREFEHQDRSELDLFLDESKLQEVIRRRKPTKWFWCDMTDLFGEWVPDEWIDRCFATMALTPQHVHQVLTKRSKRRRAYMTRPRAELFGAINEAARELTGRSDIAVLPTQCHGMVPGGWPLGNVWQGDSAEDQRRLDERVPHLLATPAAVRFLSVEPLLGPLDLRKWLNGWCPKCGGDGYEGRFPTWRELGGAVESPKLACPSCRTTLPEYPQIERIIRGDTYSFNAVHWVIVGGESGPRARPCDVEWIRSVVRQCREAGVACFVKQLGARPEIPDPRVHDMMGRITGRTSLDLDDPKGGDPSEWPEDLRVREFPS